MLRVLRWFAVATAIIIVCGAQRSYYHCNNYMCNRIDQLLKNSLDRRINPCVDFLTYTCGSRNNTADNTITSASVIDGFRGLDTEENQDANIFRSILDTNLPINNPNENVPDFLKIERQIFNRCSSHGIRSELDKEDYYKNLPVNAISLELGGNSEETTDHWIFSDMNFAGKGYGFAFFDFKIVERIDEYSRRKERYIHISPPTDNILDISSLFAKKYDSQKSHKYPKQTLLNHKKLKKFLEELNGIILQKRSDADATNIDQPQLITQWQNKWNNHVRYDTAKIDWEMLIVKHFRAAGVEAPNGEILIIVNEENYFLNLIKLLSSTNMNIIENYVNLRYVSKTIGLVDKNYIEYSPIPSISKLVCTPGLFVGTAHAYATKYFPKSNQDKLKEIFLSVRKYIRNYVMSRIDYNWDLASEGTKSFLNKLETANVMYGYPTWLLDENLLANFYPERMMVNDRYFNNVEAVYNSVQRHNLKAYYNYNLPIIDINHLFKAFESDTINIFEKNSNEIVIPVRAISETNFPFFSSSLYDSINYGSMATRLASEIYMKFLNSIEDTNDITDCMNSQLPGSFTGVKAIDYKVKATAYLKGLRTAYEIWPTKYDNSLIKFEESGAISNLQLFFISFAKTVCKNKDNDYSGIQPSQCINVVVSNMKEFQETYLCVDKFNNKQCDLLKY